MRRLLLPIAALLISDALLLVGHGIQITLLPLRAEMEGFTPTQVALTGSAYFTGFVLGCLVAPKILRRVGHIRSFAVLASLLSATVLLFHELPYFVPWLGLRFVVGCCVSGLYMIIENWLNNRTTRETRGAVLSIYTMINLTMMVAGQQLLNVADIASGTLFGLASVLLSLAIIPVCLTVTLAPTPVKPVPMDFRRVWQISHVAILGGLISGLVSGAFWSLGPLFARGVGMETPELTFFVSAVVLGGAIFQLPLGKLSDRLDRRVVLMFMALAGAVTSVLMVLFAQVTPVLLVLALVWGGMVMTQYSICLAHGADNAQPHEFVLVGSCILMLFGISSALGGPIASLFVEVLGPVGLFIYSALCLLVLAIAVAIRRQQNVRTALDDTEPFRAAADTSPAIFALDPRMDGVTGWENKSPEEENPLAGQGGPGKNLLSR